MELSPLDIPERMLQEEATGLDAAHLTCLFLNLPHNPLLLRLHRVGWLLMLLHQEIIIVLRSSLYWRVTRIFILIQQALFQ